MFPMTDLCDDLFMAETLHFDSDFLDDAFASATTAVAERPSKFNPKLRINNNRNLPKSSKLSTSEGPTSTSKFHDVADETLHFDSDLLDDAFASATTAVAERPSKFNPKLRINNNRNLPKSSKLSTSEGPTSTSKFHDVADDGHVEKFQSEHQAMTKSAIANHEYSRLDLPLLHNESLDVHGLSFSADDAIESLEIKAPSCFPADLSEERECCGNMNDFDAQSLIENEDLQTMEREHTTYRIEESNFEDCTPSIVQNDEAGKSCRKVQQENKLKTSVDNMASTAQNSKNIISEMDDGYGGSDHTGDGMPKQKKRKLPRKSDNISCEPESSIKSSKKASKKSASKDRPKKRLAHGSSRCKSEKRQVNQVLLPDDEVIRRQLVIRDLIRLADITEKISSKEAAALENSDANQSVEHEQDSNGDEANKDVEQAIRQFGTDFAMIQVLFPNRSRQQVKAKFKNEQRKHPLQIADALVHRSKDHSHFQKVIQHLQVLAEEKAKKEESDRIAQEQAEAEQMEEERTEAELQEDEDVNDFEHGDEDAHAQTPTKLSVDENDFIQQFKNSPEWM